MRARLIMLFAVTAMLGARLIAAPGNPATTTTTTAPATTTSKPATRPDPLARPTTAVEHLFKLIKQEDFSAIREVNLQSATTTELRRQYGSAVREFRAGGKVYVVDTRIDGTCAFVICRLVDAADQTKSVFSLIVIQRFDQWKVEFGQPNLRRLTPGERNSIDKLTEWSSKRLPELRELWLGSTTKPAEASGAAPAAEPPAQTP